MSNREKSSILSDVEVIDLFCGAGGLSHGLKRAGLNIIAGYDIDDTCQYAFETNNNAPFIKCDVSLLKNSDLDKIYSPNACRILVGCAPCQPFSTYNQNNNDPKWTLVGRFGELIAESMPDIVSMENVPRLREFGDGKVFESFVRTLEDAGYSLDADVLYGPDYGLPQTRSRLVLVASLRGKIALPKPTHIGNHPSVEMTIGKLKPLKAGESDDTDPLHRCANLSDLNMRRIKASKPGGSWKSWPEELVANCHKEATGAHYGSVYGRMKGNEPSPTITTQFYGFGNGRFGHPTQHRALSLREGAMLQGFPADYKFVPPGEKVRIGRVGKMIGNAVPVTLGERIGDCIIDHLRATKISSRPKRNSKSALKVA